MIEWWYERATTKTLTRKEKNEKGQKNNHLGFGYYVSNNSFDFSNYFTIEIIMATILKIIDSQNFVLILFLSARADNPSCVMQKLTVVALQPDCETNLQDFKYLNIS